ncbi:MAG: hypothetical protein H7A43_12145 [Verrucomicrobia bacterium]|nr:hypothetical protein [Verrucomicrobiota bacterium]
MACSFLLTSRWGLPVIGLLTACRPATPDPAQTEMQGQSLSVLAEAVQTVEQHYVDDQVTGQKLLIRLAVEGMVGELDDVSTVLTGAEAKRSPEELWLPIPAWGAILGPDRGKVRILSAFPGGAFSRAGIQAGMEIAFIDETPVTASMIYSPRGPVQMATTGPVSLVVGQGDLFTRRKVIPDRVGMEPLEAVPSALPGVTVIRLRWLSSDTLWLLKTKLQALAKADDLTLLLDLRGCASLKEHLARDILSLLMPSRTELWSVRTREGQEPALRTRSGPEWVPQTMVVLIDHQTSGTPELIAEALSRLDGVILAGNTSAGKAVRLSRVALENGMWLFLSSGYYLDPDGRRIGTGGVIPDIPLSGLTKDTPDALLEEALGLFDIAPSDD